MKLASFCAALMLLAACAASAPGSFADAERHDWRCDAGRAFSIRFAGEQAELFAAGRVHVLDRDGAGFSDGAVRYMENAGQARLDGAFGGPYENCRKS